MKLKKEKTKDILILGRPEKSIEMDLDLSQKNVILEILGSGFYKDPHGSIVREYTSNAWDANKEAGSDDPVIVSLKSIDGQWTLSFRDSGPGISPDRMQNVFAKYFASTKRDSNEQIGAFGLGAKSADSFLVKTVTNSVMRTYQVYKNEKKKAVIDLISEVNTNEKGTDIIINVERNDIRTFSRAIQQQLVFFTNVFVDDEYDTFKNESKIYEGKYFILRETNYYSGLRLVLGQASYEIDFNLLEIPAFILNVDLAVKFDIGEIMPNPSREAIVYSDEAKKLITKRIAKAFEELDKLVIKEHEVKSLYELYAHNTDMSMLDIKGVRVEIQCSGIQKTVPVIPRLRDLSVSAHEIGKFDILPFDCKHIDYRGKVDRYSSGMFNASKDWSHMPIFRSERSAVYMRRNLFIKSESNGNFLILTQRETRNLEDYKRLLKLHRVPKDQWRRIICTYQEFVNSIWESFPVYEDVIIPNDFMKDLYNRTLEEGEIRIMEAQWSSQIYDISFRKEYVKYHYRTPKFLVVYGTKEDKDLLKKAFCLFRTDVTRVIYTAQKNIHYFKDRKGFIKIQDFMDKHNRYFVKVVTVGIIRDFINKHDAVFNNLRTIKYLRKELFDDLYSLSQYVEKHESKSYYDRVNREFLDACIHIARTDKRYDHAMMALMDKWEETLCKLRFLKFIVPSGESSAFVSHYAKLTRILRMDNTTYQNLKEYVSKLGC